MSDAIPGLPSAGAPPRMDGVPAEKINAVPAGTEVTPKAPVPAAVDTSAVEQAFGLSTEQLKQITAKALEHGDVELLDIGLLEKAGAGKFAPLLKQVVAQQIDNATKQETLAVQQVHTVAGGKEQWDTAVKLYNTTATKEERGLVSFLFDNGREADGARIVMEYIKARGLTPGNGPSLTGAAVNAVASGLSKADFQKEWAALSKEAGNRSLESSQFKGRIEDLYRRRAIGAKAGL